MVLCFAEKLSLKHLGSQVREGIAQNGGTVLEAQVSGTGRLMPTSSEGGSWRERQLSILSLRSDH